MVKLQLPIFFAVSKKIVFIKIKFYGAPTCQGPDQPSRSSQPMGHVHIPTKNMSWCNEANYFFITILNLINYLLCTYILY